MGDLYLYYKGISAVIANGFQYDLAYGKNPTFPTWGYSWLLLISDNKKIIILLQSMLMYFCVVYFDNVVRSSKLLSEQGLAAFRWLIFFSSSAISVAATPTPYGLMIGLLLVICGILMRAEKKSGWILRYSLAGVVLGVLLNFRSDYIYLPVFIFVFLFSRLGVFAAAKRSFVFSCSTLILLIPYGMYNYKYDGSYSLTSSNGGHVFYIGLGKLPNNPWGIQPHDDDPSMRDFVEQNLGKPASTLTRSADVLLKRQFVANVVEYPFQYFKKVVFSFFLTAVSGVYVPEFVSFTDACRRGDCMERMIASLRTLDVVEIAKSADFLHVYTYISIGYGIVLFFFSSVGFAYLAAHIRSIPIPIGFCLCVFAYQLVLNSFAFQMKLYSTNVFFVGLLLLVYCFHRSSLRFEISS
jgi:hypothetical protein